MGVLWFIKQFRRRPAEVSRRSWLKVLLYVWKRSVGPPYFRSLVWLLVGITRRWWAMVVGIAFGAVTLIEYAAGADELTFSPTLVWVLLGTGLALAILGEYHSVRADRDRLAESPKVALDKHLSEGHSLHQRLMEKKLREGESPFIAVVAWVVGAEAIVQQRTPGYYEWWTTKINRDDSPGKQLISGLEVLGRISRAL